MYQLRKKRLQRMKFCRKVGATVFLGVLMQACTAEIGEHASPVPRLDFLSNPFNHCSASPPKGIVLTPREGCLIEKLSVRCDMADDCLVSCIASGQEREVGGGCWHICFEAKNDLSKWRPPVGMDSCPH